MPKSQTEKDPKAYAAVENYMIHGPCGELNRNSIFMEDNRCTKHFPKASNSETLIDKDGFPIYRRRDDGQVVEVRGSKFDNRWVLLYNPGLLMTLNCHINVEICSSIKVIKYLYKYIYKGHDVASCMVDQSENED